MSVRADTLSIGESSTPDEITKREERKVIFASSLGTVFEWYDFYLYGSLAGIISAQFFSGVNPTAGFIFALLAFAAGSRCGPSAPSSSGAWATWSGASTRSSSRSC
jgi:hypothetical protein